MSISLTRIKKVIDYLNTIIGETTSVDDIMTKCFSVRDYTIARNIIYYSMLTLETLGYVTTEIKERDSKYHHKVKVYKILKEVK